MLGGCHIKPEQFFNLIFGYYDRYWERKYVANATAGTNNLDATTVPSGEAWVLTNLRAINVNTNPSRIEFKAMSATEELGIFSKPSPGAGVDVLWCGAIYLRAGDYVRGQFVGCALNDDLYFDIIGYKMKVSQ